MPWRGFSLTFPPKKRRAYAAHQNALETFPFFAVSVVIALTMGAPVYTVNVLAVLYILLQAIVLLRKERRATRAERRTQAGEGETE